MKISVVIVTYNSEPFIAKCIASVDRAVQGIPHEILVVDNNSSDRTRQIIEHFPNSHRLLKNGKNLGFSKGINRALRESSGQFVLVMNPDVFICSPSLQPMVDFMANHPNIGVMGCKMLNLDNSLQYSKGSFATLFSILHRGILPRPMRKYDFWGYDKMGPCDWVTGAFMLIKRDLIEKVGYFDENYFLYYEDMDFCLQAKRLGWQSYYYPGITAYHVNPHARRQISPLNGHEIERANQNSRVYFFKKNRSSLSYWIVRLLTQGLGNHSNYKDA
jgi:GT2 family glycosyltransferase